MLNRRQTLSLLSLGLPPLLATTTAQAQATTFPSRPVTVIVPQPAGTPNDAIARKMLPGLQQALGQPVVVENLGGAGGTIGVNRVMSQPVDGHTLLIGTPTEMILSPLTIPDARYKPVDFTMLVQFGKISYVLCARPTLEVNSLADVLALKGKGGAPLTMGNIGVASMIHLISLQFEKLSTLNVTHVPYRGVAPIITDVMGGQLDLAFLPLAGGIAALIDQGKLKAIGVSTARPSAMFPKFPTLAAGHSSFANFDYDVWAGVMTRRDTPAPVQQRLYQALAGVMVEPEFLNWARSTGSSPAPVLSQAEAQAFYAREITRSTALLKAFPDVLK
ncbi:MAG: tripartite tricarboxylate transporter substrate binding protein [Hydrogenophaga sp.]|nr:tripartite tricarboxylate transporter substrate binding protein [Hydrogenophaga sp.]